MRSQPSPIPVLVNRAGSNHVLNGFAADALISTSVISLTGLPVEKRVHACSFQVLLLCSIAITSFPCFVKIMYPTPLLYVAVL